MGIKDRSDLDTAEEGQEDINAEDPPDGALIVIPELVLTEILIENADRVPMKN